MKLNSLLDNSDVRMIILWGGWILITICMVGTEFRFPFFNAQYLLYSALVLFCSIIAPFAVKHLEPQQPDTRPSENINERPLDFTAKDMTDIYRKFETLGVINERDQQWKAVIQETDELYKKAILERDTTINQLSNSIRLQVNQTRAKPNNPRQRIKHIDHSGFVYLIRAHDGLYKIGHTKDPHDRLRTFQNKLPFDVEYEHLIQCKDRHKAERQLHLQFAHCRVRGEWFKLTLEDVATIKAIKKL